MSSGSSDGIRGSFPAVMSSESLFLYISVLPEICSIWLPGRILLWPDEIANIPERFVQKASCFE